MAGYFPFNSRRSLLVGALYRPPSSNVDIDTRIVKNIENDEVLDQHMPWKNKRVKRRSQPPWMNDEILKLIFERGGLMKTARRTNLSIDWYLYTRAKCKTSNLIKHAKRCFFQETIDKNKGNSKGIWKALKTPSGVKKDN